MFARMQLLLNPLFCVLNKNKYIKFKSRTFEAFISMGVLKPDVLKPDVCKPGRFETWPFETWRFVGVPKKKQRRNLPPGSGQLWRSRRRRINSQAPTPEKSLCVVADAAARWSAATAARPTTAKIGGSGGSREARTVARTGSGNFGWSPMVRMTAICYG